VVGKPHRPAILGKSAQTREPDSSGLLSRSELVNIRPPVPAFGLGKTEQTGKGRVPSFHRWGS